MKKRWIALLLILSLLCALAACGGQGETEATAETEAASIETTEAVIRIPITSVPADLFGTCSDSLYTNSLLQLQLELPADWYFYGASRLAALSGITLGEEEEATKEKFMIAMKVNGISYDMVACGNDDHDTLSVCFEHPGHLYGQSMSEQAYAEMVLQSFSERLSGIDSGAAGAELCTFSLGSNEHPCLQFLSSENGNTLHKTMVFVQVDEYIAIISASSPYEGNDTSVLDRFSYYEVQAPEAEETPDEG